MLNCPKCDTLTTLDDKCPTCGIVPRNYKHLLPHQQRVVDEQIALNTKISALNSFIHTTDVFYEQDKAEQQLLISQLEIMEQYSKILSQRIAKYEQS